MKTRAFRPVPLMAIPLGLAIMCGTALPTPAAPGKTRLAIARNLASAYVGELALGDTLRPEERAFLLKATETGLQQMRLAADYRRISEALDAMVRRKGGIAGAPVGGTSEAYRKLLENPGAEFDREFVLAAAQLTETAITLFEQAAADAKDTDVREFAGAQLPVLRAHYNTIVALKRTVG
jgi:putative membrane protein